jgi:hypothetical protein
VRFSLRSRNPFWDGPDPFGLGPDNDAAGAARPRGHGAGTWLAVIVVIVLTVLIMVNAPAVKAQPVPCDAQANLSPPVQGSLAAPVQMPASQQVVVPAAPPRLDPTPYRQVRERVENGQKLIVLVNPPSVHTIPTRVGWTTLRVDNEEIPAGQYEAFKDADGTAKWELKERYLPPPVTAEGWGWQLAPPAAFIPLGQFRGVFRGT